MELTEFGMGRGHQDAKHPLAQEMRDYAEAHPWDGEDPADLPEAYWGPPSRRTVLLIGFWCSPDGREHLVLMRRGEKPPWRRTVRLWHWLFWPPGTNPDLEVRVDGPRVWITNRGSLAGEEAPAWPEELTAEELGRIVCEYAP